MARLRGKLGRFLALLALIAGILVPVVVPVTPTLAVPAEQGLAQAGMDCSGMHHQTPRQHLPTGVDCCVANVCAMTLALPAAPLGIALPGLFGTRDYDLRALPQPAGIDSAPIPHPPKTIA